jgi:transcriptional regulator with XRE-family HTH domain
MYLRYLLAGPQLETSPLAMGRRRHTLGEAVRCHRDALGLNRSEVAQRAGISRGHLYAIEFGRLSPTIEQGEALAAALETELAELLHEARVLASTRKPRQVGEYGALPRLPSDPASDGNDGGSNCWTRAGSGVLLPAGGEAWQSSPCA